jgi:hypothetical protein
LQQESAVLPGNILLLLMMCMIVLVINTIVFATQNTANWDMVTVNVICLIISAYAAITS